MDLRRARTGAIPEDSEDENMYDSDNDPEYQPDDSDVSETSDEEEETEQVTFLKNKRTPYQWKDVDPGSEKVTPVWTGDCDYYNEVQEPVDYFKHFFDNQILKKISEESNLFSVQKNINKALKIDVNELEQFIGCCIFMSIYGLPRSRMYWATSTRVDKVSNVMSRDRWETIKSNIHFNDNSNMLPLDDPNRDKLFKVRPLVDHLANKFRSLPKTEQILCVDEQIVPFKGHSSLKQYNPKKPKKWGYKIFVLSDTKGLIHDFDVYTGTIIPVCGFPDLGSSSNIVLKLAQTIPQNQGFLLYFDNWFASLKLFTTLADIGILALGTIRVNRFPDLEFASDRDMSKKGRGTFQEKSVTIDGTELRALKWFDRRAVALASTFASAEPVGEAKRYDKKTKTDILVPCPQSILTYNSFMGGVDLIDGLVAYYRIKIRSKKYYLRFFFHFIDLAIVNGWGLYRRDCKIQQIPEKDQMDLLDFRSHIADSLCNEGKICEKKRGRPSSADAIGNELEKKKHRGPTVAVPTDCVRRDHIGHWPFHDQARQRCKRPNCKGLTSVKCNKCQIHLCFTSTKNCFSEFHQ